MFPAITLPAPPNRMFSATAAWLPWIGPVLIAHVSKAQSASILPPGCDGTQVNQTEGQSPRVSTALAPQAVRVVVGWVRTRPVPRTGLKCRGEPGEGQEAPPAAPFHRVSFITSRGADHSSTTRTGPENTPRKPERTSRRNRATYSNHTVTVYSTAITPVRRVQSPFLSALSVRSTASAHT